MFFVYSNRVTKLIY